MECYDDSDPCTVFTIINDSGKKAGFATFVEEMMSRLVDAGACFYPFHELKSLVKVNDGGLELTELRFSNGVIAKANITTILNLPQKPLMSVVRNSNFDEAGLIDAPTLDALHSVQSVIATKLYLYYPLGHVFWRRLGLKAGDYEFAVRFVLILSFVLNIFSPTSSTADSFAFVMIYFYINFRAMPEICFWADVTMVSVSKPF
jgi:hypothetical protein